MTFVMDGDDDAPFADRRRVVSQLVLVAVLGCLIAGVTMFQTSLPLKLRRHQVGVGAASALVDTSQSQVGTSASGSANGDVLEALAFRALLLANLMATPAVEGSIAKDAGISESDLVVVPDATAGSADAPASVFPTHAAKGMSTSTLQITVPSVTAGQLPIIQVNTQSASPAAAARLANGAIAAVRAEVQTASASSGPPLPSSLVVRPLGPATAAWRAKGTSPIIGVFLGLLVLFGGALAVFQRAASRRAGRREWDGISDQPTVTVASASVASLLEAGEEGPDNKAPDEPVEFPAEQTG